MFHTFTETQIVFKLYATENEETMTNLSVRNES